MATASEKAFSCPWCHSSYAYQRGLQNHIRLTHDKKEFVCVICEKDFIDKESLDQHIQGQELLKPIEPEIREKNFPEFLYRDVCYICDNTFLKDHEQCHHNKSCSPVSREKRLKNLDLPEASRSLRHVGLASPTKDPLLAPQIPIIDID